MTESEEEELDEVNEVNGVNGEAVEDIDDMDNSDENMDEDEVENVDLTSGGDSGRIEGANGDLTLWFSLGDDVSKKAAVVNDVGIEEDDIVAKYEDKN